MSNRHSSSKLDNTLIISSFRQKSEKPDVLKNNYLKELVAEADQPRGKLLETIYTISTWLIFMDNEPTMKATFLQIKRDVFDRKEQRSKKWINRQAGIPKDENLASVYELDNKPARWAPANLSSSTIDFRSFQSNF